MNATNQRTPIRFGSETRLDMRPAAPAPFRALQESELERLKHRLLGERLAATAEPELDARLRRAADEAASLAWVTPVPALVFPELFEEKVRTALRQASLQREILKHSRELILAA